jgi:hypothetical protein
MKCPNCGAIVYVDTVDAHHICLACHLAGPRDALEALAKRLADIEQLALDHGEELLCQGEDLRKLQALANLRRKQLRQARAALRARVASSVHITEMRRLIALCETYAAGGSDVAKDLLEAWREFVAGAERRAGAKEAEHG